jgi:hypothetical protein
MYNSVACHEIRILVATLRYIHQVAFHAKNSAYMMGISSLTDPQKYIGIGVHRFYGGKEDTIRIFS